MYNELVKRLRNCIDSYCAGCKYESLLEPGNFVKCMNALIGEAADAIEELSKIREEQKAQIILMATEDKPRWIPVTEGLPGTGVDVLVKFPQNMAVASIDNGEWVVNSGDGWCTDINLAGGEKNPTHWMPLPQPPEEES